jgi:hypothetical protein
VAVTKRNSSIFCISFLSRSQAFYVGFDNFEITGFDAFAAEEKLI